MQFEIGKPDYPFAHLGEILGGAIEGERERDLPLLLVDLPQMVTLREQNPHMRAVPQFIAFDRAAQRLWVYPSPAGEYVFHVKHGPEDVSAPGTLRVGAPSVALPPGTIGPPLDAPGEYFGTITKPMLKRGK